MQFSPPFRYFIPVRSNLPLRVNNPKEHLLKTRSLEPPPPASVGLCSSPSVPNWQFEISHGFNNSYIVNSSYFQSTTCWFYFRVHQQRLRLPVQGELLPRWLSCGSRQRVSLDLPSRGATLEEVAAPVKKTEITAGGILRADHTTPSVRRRLATNFANKRRSLGRYNRPRSYFLLQCISEGGGACHNMTKQWTIEYERFWVWCVTLKITGFVDWFHLFSIRFYTWMLVG
jgi:hypothetical protein